MHLKFNESTCKGVLAAQSAADTSLHWRGAGMTACWWLARRVGSRQAPPSALWHHLLCHQLRCTRASMHQLPANVPVKLINLPDAHAPMTPFTCKLFVYTSAHFMTGVCTRSIGLCGFGTVRSYIDAICTSKCVKKQAGPCGPLGLLDHRKCRPRA